MGTTRGTTGLRRTTVAAAAVLAGALMLTGCGDSSSGASGQRTALPGTREFGLTDQQFTDHVERAQALIADCMHRAGFEYVPVDVKTVEAGQARVRTQPGYTRQSYKEKWGLAVTTRFDDPPRDVGLGPNLQIWQGLPPAEQTAYSRTLWGEDPKADFVFSLDEEDFSGTGGCTRQGVAKVFTKSQLKGTYVNPKDVLIDSDPRIVKALHAWSLCMHGHGYEYKRDQDEIIDEYADRLDELLQGDDPATLSGTRLAALHKLQQQEIAVSLADLDCQIKHTDEVYTEVETEVYGHPLDLP